MTFFFFLSPFFPPSPRTTRHHRSIIVHFRFASFSIRAPVSGTWPNNAWRTSQRKIERAGGNENYRASRPGLTGPWCVQRSTRLAVRRRGEKARYHWNTLERKKERGGPRERTSGARRGKLICAQPGSFNPSPSATLAREKIDTVTLRGVNRRDELPLFFSSSSACFSFLSFFFFKFHEGQIRYGKYVSRVVASYRVRERKYISVFMRGKREEFRMGYVRRNSWEFVRRVRIVGIKFKIVSSERLEVIEFQKIWRNIYIYSNISGRGFKYVKLNHVVS